MQRVNSVVGALEKAADGVVDLEVEGTSQTRVDGDRQSAVVVPMAVVVAAAVGVVASTLVSERRSETEGGGVAMVNIGIEQR